MATADLRTEERYTEADYDDMLNESYGEVSICGLKYQASYALREVDPVAYRCGFADFQEEIEIWTCSECGEEFGEQWEAEECCEDDDEEDDEE